jgi:hypothetical protein
MVKLIKINNKSQIDGRITANFDNLEITKNSQVALLNASITVQDKVIEVTDANNKLKFRLITGVEKEANIINGFYSPSEFAAMLQKVLNSNLEYVYNTGQDVALLNDDGFQWKVILTADNRLSISFNRVERFGENIIANKEQGLTVTDGNAVPNGGGLLFQNYMRTSDNTDGWDAFIIGDKFFTDGCGSLQFTTLVGGTNFLCGLTSKDLSGATEVTPYDIEYGFYKNTAGTARVKYLNLFGESVDMGSGFTPSNGDQWFIILSGGKLRFIYIPVGGNNPGVPVEITSIDWNYDNKHYVPVLCIYTANNNTTGGNQGKINEVLFYSDPYNVITDIYNDYEDIVDSKVTDLQLQATTVRIDFEGNQLLYGFNNPFITRQAVKYTFFGTISLKETHLPNNVNVYLKNMQLQSYDNLNGERCDILMSLPALQYSNNRFIYTGNEAIFIDISNQEPMNITQLNLEIKEYNGKYIKTLPNVCDLTLLIRDSPMY